MRNVLLSIAVGLVAASCGGSDSSSVAGGDGGAAGDDGSTSADGGGDDAGTTNDGGTRSDGGTTNDGGTRNDGGTTAGPIKTVFLVLMENHNWSSIKGSASAPYINNTLLRMGAHAENYYDNPNAVHPSEPNYIWLEAGLNLGITDDADPSTNHQSTTDHLVTKLTAAGVTWKAYTEDIPGGSCPITGTGKFAPKHTPMLFFDDVVGNPPSTTSAPCIAHIVPYGQLATDLANHTVAQYNFITPNLCNDMHDAFGCATLDSVKNGDTWLSTEIPKILASAAYADGGAIFITWDESEGGEYPIGMIVLSNKAKAGYASTGATKLYHSSMLRTVQDIFGITPLLRDAANRPNLGDLFTSFP